MNAPPPDVRGGPQFYLHVEFGVSWNKKPATNHEVTYRSKGFRERAPNFPRQVPAPNTNYLAAIHGFDQRQARVRQSRALQPRSHPHPIPHPNPNVQNHQMQEYYQVPGRPHPPAAAQQTRQARSESRGNQERGRSAPPPIGDNPWDQNYARNRDSTQTQGNQWKALPAEPSQFRLGEGGQPWSAWSMPLEYQGEGSEGRSEGSRGRERQRQETAYALSSTLDGPVLTPEPDMVLRRDQETGRTRELGALSAAMMTVDNGFEQQWWFQGPRHSVEGPDRLASTLQHPFSASSPELVMSGHSGDGFDEHDHDHDRNSSNAGGTLVSPLSASEGSPIPTFQSLHRSRSTRSEELFFHG
jgi:hypothetical protein